MVVESLENLALWLLLYILEELRSFGLHPRPEDYYEQYQHNTQSYSMPIDLQRRATTPPNNFPTSFELLSRVFRPHYQRSK